MRPGDNKSNTTPLVIVLATLVVFDLIIIAGIFIKGHANFSELIKHLHS